MKIFKYLVSYFFMTSILSPVVFASAHTTKPLDSFTFEDRIEMPPEVSTAYTPYRSKVNEWAKAGIDHNVHTYNQTSGLRGAVHAFWDADRFDYAEDVDTAIIQAEMTTFASEEQVLDIFSQTTIDTSLIERNFTRLKAHFKTSVRETVELDVDVSGLLNRCWQLAKRLDEASYAKQLKVAAEEDTGRKVQFDRVTFRSSAITAVCESLATSGGCYAGFSGRLAKLYVELLSYTYMPES